jgi:large conductance mechanosensitive channel
MLRGFRDFITRGNVIELAVGVVIGVAFTNMVNAFTNSFLTPLIRAFGGDTQLAGTWDLNGQKLDWAGFVNAVITFLITAAVVYFLIVLPMNKLAERRRTGEEPPPAAPSEEVRLLTEIRDALVAGNGGRPAPSEAPSEAPPEDAPPTRPEPVTRR